jgi:hypothetical protein
MTKSEENLRAAIKDLIGLLEMNATANRIHPEANDGSRLEADCYSKIATRLKNILIATQK